MASDSLDSRRKHRRRSSSPEEVDRSSKRHKHRHHSHRHHHHHHRDRHGTKKRGEESKYDVETTERFHTLDANLGSDGRRPEDDVEEGEILEEEGLRGSDGEIGKKETESDAESGEIQVTEDKPNLGLFNKKTSFHKEGDTVGINFKDSKNNGEDISAEKFVTSPAMNGEERGSSLSHAGSSNRSSVDPQDGSLGNGYLEPKSSKEYKKQKGNEKLRGNYDDEDVDVNGVEVSMHRNSSSESAREKSRTLGRSPSCNRHRSQSRSSGHTRDRSRSHGRVEECIHSKRRGSGKHETISYAGRDDTDYDLDEEKRVKYSKNHGRGSRSLETDDPRENSTSHSSIYTRKEDSHYHWESGDRERSKGRDVDRDFSREKEQERSRNREIEHLSRREKERERSYERDRRHVEEERGRRHERDRREVEEKRGRRREVDRDGRREKDRDRSWDTVVERGRRRDKERDSRDRTKGGERDRDRESELDDKKWDRDRIKEREKRDDRNRHKHGITGNDKNKDLVHKDGHESQDTYRHLRHSRHEETEHHQDRRRTSEPQNSLERGEGKIERVEDEHDDLDEKLQLAEHEEEDLIRIKEESRRRREAILEKYKMQQQQVEQMPENDDKDKEHVDVPTAVPEIIDGNNDGVDIYEAETSFAIGKSPRKNGNADIEKISGAGGLGEGTPKSERSGDKSDDMFCDDIFGETPTRVHKSGKGDGLRIERGGLNDNWDDAEGYYSYRFGEILDGRYEVTAGHGKGVFSTVARAKNLKSGNGEPEEVAIKIIRNNDTMYKAGMDELVILKKLVGADPDDKRHCVRFLSSFKYRNHLCLVFESLNMNLREVLKKFGRNIGLRLTAVRAYAKQLFIALKHLRNCGVLHCDIKPDNMLVNEAKNVLKLCDFGNAMFAGKNELTPYLVSRFYRAPEIILGLPYDHPLDMWSVGCCLYELYTGKVLFPGPTNNDMLRLHMELKGPFPKKMLRKGAFIEQHFDQDLNFLAIDEDPVTKKTIRRVIVNIKPKDMGTMITGSPGEDPKMLANFKDLLEKIFVLDPEKRLTVSQALNHPFITGK